MPEVSAKTIEPPAHDRVNPVVADVAREPVERWAPVLRAGHALVHVLRSDPPARFDVAPQLEELILRRLIQSAHPRVNSDAANDGHAASEYEADAGRLGGSRWAGRRLLLRLRSTLPACPGGHCDALLELHAFRYQ